MRRATWISSVRHHLCEREREERRRLTSAREKRKVFCGSRITTLGRRALGDIRGSSARRVRCARPMKLTYRLVNATLKREHLVDVVCYVTHVAEEFKAGLAQLRAGGDPQRRVVRLVWVWNRRGRGSGRGFSVGGPSRVLASGVCGPLDAGRCGWARRASLETALKDHSKNSGTFHHRRKFGSARPSTPGHGTRVRVLVRWRWVEGGAYCAACSRHVCAC